MKTNQKSPSGVRSRISTAVKSILHFPTGRKNMNHNGLRAFLVVLLVVLGIGEMWAGAITGASSYVKTETAATAEGLVYCSKSSSANPSQSDYKRYYPGGSATGEGNEACYVNLGAAKSGVYIYCWAKPARGYEFDHWDGYEKGYLPYGDQNKSKKLDIDSWNGVKDQMVGTCGNGASTWKQHQAYFKPATFYTITYTPPVGGSYSVSYSYLNTRPTTGEEYEFYTDNSEKYDLTPSSENVSVKSYKDDVITLTSSDDNFIGWYEGEIQKSTANPYTYPVTDTKTVSARFKWVELGSATGDLTPRVNSIPAIQTNYSVTIPVTAVGTWSASDFTVTFTEKTTPVRNNITKGEVTLTSSTLTIPFTYNPTQYNNTEIEVTVTPQYGEGIVFSILAESEEVVDYEACIEENGVRTYTGTLAAMMTQANTMTNKPTVKLMNPVTITTPLLFTKSMTFDVNGKVLTASCASAFSIDAAGIDVQIIDGSFTQVGEIHTSSSSASNVNVVTFTQKAKLTMQGGTLSASNIGSGSAYGVNVCNGSIFYMTNGQLTVSANTGDAHGVHVASANDYATLNGGSITVTAPANAYGLWSVGQSNITNATINVETTGGANAYGVYINGGVSTLTTNTITATAKTTGAYGAYVNAGRLNGNGGSFTAEAVTSGVYGVHVAAGATAMMQMNAVVTAEATGASGTSVFGVNNLGTVSLSNITVTATSPTNNATAVNSATSAVSTTIEGGTYTANVETGKVYGLHHQYGTLTVDGGTFKGILKTSGANAYGARFAADGTVSNATILGETRGTGTTAYGVVGGVANKNITLTNCTITGQSNTSKAYAIYSRSNVTATGCTLTATTLGANYACGFYAESGTNRSVNTNATVSSNTTQAYGVYHAAGSMLVNGGEYNVQAKQATAADAQNSELYGLYNSAGQTTNVNGVSFNAIAGNAAYSQNVYGAYINGTLSSTEATYNAEAKLNVYGVWGNTASTLNLSGNSISTRATNGKVSYGIYAKKNFTIDGDIVSAVGSTTSVYAMFFDASTSVGDVLGGKFSAQGNGTNGFGALNDKGTVGKVKLRGGVYKTTINLQKYVHTGYQVFHLDETHADYADGYRYTIATENPSPYVCCIVGGAYYATLEAALQYTQDHSGTFTIVMTQNYTLPAGDYVLPVNATLIVPRKFGQTTITENGDPAIADKITAVGLNENFLCLTMASDAHLNVDGKIGVSGEMYCTESGGVSNQSPYGRIHMESGSHIQLNSGAYLYAWGMITGTGSITVKSNAEVREMFQVKNMPSASNLRYYVREYNTSNTTRYMPFNQYSIQNIEVPTTYYHNSRLMSEMRCYYSAMGGTWYGDPNIKLVGTSGALFEVTSEDESSWVRKSYDATNKQQVWEVNTAAQLGSISITMTLPIVSTKITISSANYILPITNTMKIHVLDGDFAITNDTEFMPGSSVEVNKTASLTVNSGKKVYVFDQHQWSSNTSYADAAINVHGNINVKGALYTTKSIEDGPTNANKTYGANIYSTNADAGTIFFENDAPSTTTTIDLITGIENSAIKTKTVTMDPAQLKNGNGSFTATSGTEKDHSFAYMDNTWTRTYSDECFEYIGDDAYAKPSDYVKLKKQRDAMGEYDDLYIKDNHTYESADGSRIFIHLPGTEGECQWWEVEATDNPTVFECKKEGYEGFYYYDEIWTLKTVTVTFYSKEEGEGDDILHTIVTDFNGRPDPSVIPSNPTKATTPGFTYQFYGWKSSVTGYTYKWTDPLEVATADMSYRPVFTETKRNYTITLINANNGANVPLEVPYGDTPEYTPKKDPTAQYTYTFDHWAPTFSAVTGPATYTAHWNSVVNNYNIIWKNGDEVLERDENQPYGTATAYNGDTPTKEMDDQYEYTFSKWKSSLDGNLYNDGSTPTIAGETTYEAQYTTTPRYVITFNNYDGTQLARIIYTQGETPAYVGVPTRKRDADGYFRFIGWKNSDGDDYAANETLPNVTKKETYTAQYDYVTDLYLITLRNVKGKGSAEEDNIWSGKFGVGSTPFYDPNEDDIADAPTKAGNAQYTYTFDGWSLTQDGEKLNPVPEVSGVATYWALFEQHLNTYYITFANVDGKGAQQQVEYDYGETPEYSGVVSMYSDGTHLYSFRAWKQTSNEQEYTTTLPTVVGNETYTAQYDVVETLDVNDDITVDENTSLGITTVHVSGKLNVADGVTFTTTNLILEASGDASGQIIENGAISATNVYYDLKLNTDARHWHAFGVPWAVDINTDKLVEVDNDGNVVRTLHISRDYEIMYYDGAERAAHGPSPDCWKYLRHYEDTEHGQPVDELVPGHGYMIAFGSHVNTVRFTKKSGALIIFDGSNSVIGGAGEDGGWNAIANPMAYHATLNAGPVVGYVHDGGEIGNDGYVPYDIEDKCYVVGKMVYVQAADDATVVVEPADNKSIISPMNAPRRTKAATDNQYLSLRDYYTVSLANQNGVGSKVYVLPEEDKADEYVIGHDLSQFSMTTLKPQICVNRYESKLALNTTAPVNEVALFPISVYAPAAGEYTLCLQSQPDDEYTVYLTKDGKAIWNLSMDSYSLELAAGTNKSYGLRLTARKSPSVATGIDEAVVDAQGETRKVIINDKVFIIRGENVYSVDGQLVK